MSECQGYIILFKNTSQILPWPLALNRDKANSSLRCFKINNLFLASFSFFTGHSQLLETVSASISYHQEQLHPMTVSGRSLSWAVRRNWEKVVVAGRFVSGSCSYLPEAAAAVLWQLIHSLWKRHLSLQVSFILE